MKIKFYEVQNAANDIRSFMQKNKIKNLDELNNFFGTYQYGNDNTLEIDIQKSSFQSYTISYHQSQKGSVIFIKLTNRRSRCEMSVRCSENIHWLKYAGFDRKKENRVYRDEFTIMDIGQLEEKLTKLGGI